MARSYAYGRMVLGGTLGATDSWSVGFAFSGGDFEASSALQAMTDDFLSHAHGWWNGSAPNVSPITSSDSYFNSVRAYYYEAGAESASSQAETLDPSPPSGAESAVQALKTACVVTLLTGIPGRSGKGRMYVPADGATLSTHQFQGTDVDHVATATANLLIAFNAAGYLSGLALASVATKTGLHPIAEVRVDALPDSQRRRQNKLVSNHQALVTV